MVAIVRPETLIRDIYFEGDAVAAIKKYSENFRKTNSLLGMEPVYRLFDRKELSLIWFVGDRRINKEHYIVSVTSYSNRTNEVILEKLIAKTGIELLPSRECPVLDSIDKQIKEETERMFAELVLS